MARAALNGYEYRIKVNSSMSNGNFIHILRTKDIGSTNFFEAFIRRTWKIPVVALTGALLVITGILGALITINSDSMVFPQMAAGGLLITGIGCFTDAALMYFLRKKDIETIVWRDLPVSTESLRKTVDEYFKDWSGEEMALLLDKTDQKKLINLKLDKVDKSLDELDEDAQFLRTDLQKAKNELLEKRAPLDEYFDKHFKLMMDEMTKNQGLATVSEVNELLSELNISSTIEKDESKQSYEQVFKEVEIQTSKAQSIA